MANPTIYFARAGTDGPIKIGYTGGNPLSRIADLQTGCPWRITLIGSIPGTTREESRLHEIFSDLRREGEWFDAAEKLTAAIDALIAGSFEWPIERPKVSIPRDLPENPTISDIIWAAGGPNRISSASNGQVTSDAVYKWRRNGIRDWNWPLLMSLCDVSASQLYAANQMALPAPAQLRVA